MAGIGVQVAGGGVVEKRVLGVPVKLENEIRTLRASFNADCEQALVCDLKTKDFRMYDVKLGKCLCTFSGHIGTVWDMKWSADESGVVSGGEDGTVRVWDTRSVNCTAKLMLRSSVYSVSWLPGDKHVAAGLYSGAIEFWDVERVKSVRTLHGHTEAVYNLDVTADKRLLLSASSDKTARLWNLDSGDCVHILQGHNRAVWSAVFSRNGLRALSGSADATVRLWDLENGKCVRTIEGHTKAVITVSWHPSNPSLAVSGADDKTVRVWNVDSGVCLGLLDGHVSDVQWYLRWSGDGQRLTSCDHSGHVISWDLATILVATNNVSDHVQYTNAKVLLVGDSGAGKTGLSMRLVKDAWGNSDSTLGAWSTRWPLGVAHDATGTGEREIWLWDFGGQHDQRLVHQLFMDDTALAVLVFDGQRDGVLDTLRQWDRDIARASRAGCRKLLVSGRVDAGPPRMSREDLEKFAKENGFEGYYETSAKDGTGCTELKTAIAHAIDWDKIPWRSSPATFESLKKVLLTIKDAALAPPRPGVLRALWQFMSSLREPQTDGEPQRSKVPGRVLVTQADLASDIRARERGLQFSDEQLKAVLSLLAGPGVVWELKFGGYYLLHPELVGSYLQGLLRQDRLQFGYALEKDVFAGELPANVTRLDDPTKDRLLLLELHHTLLERALCYREMTQDKGAILIFPTRFAAVPPEVRWQPPVIVSYTFAGYVDEAYATLVVRLHHTEPFKQAVLFRDYAVFTTASGQVGVKIKRSASADPIEFEVFREPRVADNTVIEYCAFVHEHLLQYGQDVRRLRHFHCSNCARVVTDREAVMVKIKKYIDAENKGLKVDKPIVVCALCDEPVTLWDSIEEHYARADYQDRVRELQEYSKSKLQQQAAERVLIADIISLVLQAEYEVEELPVPFLGANLKVTFKPVGAAAMVVLGTPESVRDSARTGIFTETDARGSTPTSRNVEVDALQFAPEWASRRLCVILVVRVPKQHNDVERSKHQSDGELQWMQLSGVRIQHQKVAFEGRQLNVAAVRGWKDLPTSAVEEGLNKMNLTDPVKPLPWTQRDRRNDVFLSFRGTEPLEARSGAPTDTVREQLVKPLAADLRRQRSVYFDETGLADQRKAAPGVAIIDILQGIMSTQGGGVAVLLISRTYFEREWPTLELAACVELHNARQVRLLPLLLGEGVTPDWVKGQRFVQEVCSALSSVQMHTVPRGTADAMRAFIKKRIEGALGDDGISGGSAEESFSTLKITIANRLRADRDADQLAVALTTSARQGQTLLSVLGNVPNLSSKNIAPLRNALWKYFDTDEFRDLCDLVDRYEFKWHYLASDESAAVTDFGAVKARVDHWWAANPRRSRAGEGQ